ncbi:MAG TPA: hypothetical protein VF458_09965, partial [Ktedonobacteraceae bacterium]
EVPAVPARKSSLRCRAWFVFALVGAVTVVALYLVVPLMIFLGIVRDLLTQLLGALLLLTIAELVIVSILLKTARSMKPISGKMRAALLNTQDNDNAPFDIIVDSETVGIPAQHRKGKATTKSQQRVLRQSVAAQSFRSQPLSEAPLHPQDEK